MRKNSIFEKLQNYFNNTNREEIERVWEETSVYNDVDSPTVEVFIESSGCFFNIKKSPPEISHQNFVNKIESPNFTSDFLFEQNYGKSKFFNRTILF